MADGLAGNAWLITGTFTQSGVPTDPGVVPTFTITDPTGAVTTPTPNHVGTGSYTATVYCPTPAQWECIIAVSYPNQGYGATKVLWTVGAP